MFSSWWDDSVWLVGWTTTLKITIINTNQFKPESSHWLCQSSTNINTNQLISESQARVVIGFAWNKLLDVLWVDRFFIIWKTVTCQSFGVPAARVGTTLTPAEARHPKKRLVAGCLGFALFFFWGALLKYIIFSTVLITNPRWGLWPVSNKGRKSFEHDEPMISGAGEAKSGLRYEVVEQRIFQDVKDRWGEDDEEAGHDTSQFTSNEIQWELRKCELFVRELEYGLWFAWCNWILNRRFPAISSLGHVLAPGDFHGRGSPGRSKRSCLGDWQMFVEGLGGKSRFFEERLWKQVSRLASFFSWRCRSWRRNLAPNPIIRGELPRKMSAYHGTNLWSSAWGMCDFNSVYTKKTIGRTNVAK